MTFEHKARILAVLLVGVNACTSMRTGPATQEHVWPAYLGSSARVSERLDTSTADPQPVWRAGVGRGIVGAPALAEDVVALAQVDQQVVLLDRATGDVLWRRRIGGHAAGGPLLADDRLLAASQGRGGTVVALRLVDGRRLWSTHVGDVVSPLALDGGVVYAGTSEGWVVALDARTGRQRWRVRVPGAVRAAPVPLGTAVAVATTRDSIFLLEASTGRIDVRQSTPGTVLAAPALAHGRLVIGTTAGRLAALDPASLATVWFRDAGGPVVGAVAIRDRIAYAVTANGVLWSIPVDSAVGTRADTLHIVARAGPLPAPRGTYVVSVDGRLSRIGARGESQWTVRLRSPVIEPVVQDGSMLFAVSQRGEVVAFR
ncbi:MAG: hypothetical protein A2085_10365 [Gemmatimonadetes bacterium GWC2_71_10]|nr:MAG: hypothetical protein A2085_10365 [Gemmatimonadetes bacterium GWC2_71_10]